MLSRVDMELPPRVASAMNAMEALGLSWEKTKPILKNLLKVFEHNWDYIESENYRVLADAVLDSLESGDSGFKINRKHPDDDVDKKDDQVENDSADSFSGKRVKPGKDASSDKGTSHEPSKNEHKRKASATIMNRSLGHKPQQLKNPISSTMPSRPPPARIIGPSHELSKNEHKRKASTTIINRPLGYMPQQLKTPISSTMPSRPPPAGIIDKGPSHELSKNEHKRKASATIINRPLGYKPQQLKTPISSTMPSRPPPARIIGTSSGKESSLHDSDKNASTSLDKSAQDSSSIKIELASSTSGEVRLVILCDPALPCPNFQMPSMKIICKMVEDRYLKSYKIIEPHFTLISLLKEMCHCVVELSSKSSEEQGNISIIQGINPVFSNGRPDYQNLKTFSNNQSKRGMDNDDTIRSGAVANDSLSLVVFQPQHSSSSTRTVAICDTDICRGEENVKISLENAPSVRCPPLFHYIPRNIVYQNAYVNISLARIGDEDCCSACSGDCLAASIPCPCARETGGDYAYTSEGLMKMEFLDAIISMKRDRLRKHLYFCKDCPIERIRNEMMPEPCKGHLIRKFVKECWSKCGCNRICGNRLVQRGITRNLQVFWTAEGKGWGLRTLDELPRGAFICEYVGEILTNSELFDRQLRVTGKMRHTYPVLLDADWGSEQVLKDEEALCLDATFYGNVARFINHRCADANIVEVPVEVETPDHHYYHLAFFTVRRVEALEELTWDYGIDFDDQNHPIKAFSCRCGSKLCRDRTQIRKRPSLVLG